MKKLFLLLAIASFTMATSISCTPYKIEDQENALYQSDKDVEPEDEGNG